MSTTEPHQIYNCTDGISLFERIHQPNLPLVYTPESGAKLGADLAHTALTLLQRLAGGAASEYTIKTESSHRMQSHPPEEEVSLLSLTPPPIGRNTSAELPNSRRALRQMSPHSLLFTDADTLALVALPEHTPVETNAQMDGQMAPFGEEVKRWQTDTAASKRGDAQLTLQELEDNCVHAIGLIVLEVTTNTLGEKKDEARGDTGSARWTPDLNTLAAVSPKMAEILKDAIAVQRTVDKQRVTLVTLYEELAECAGETNMEEEDDDDEDTSGDAEDSDAGSIASSEDASQHLDEGDTDEEDDSSLDY